MTEYIVEVSDFVIDAHGKSPFEGHEEIVRCQDCAYYDDEHGLDGWGPKCWCDPEHRGTAVWTRPDGFCWRAKRRSEL